MKSHSENKPHQCTVCENHYKTSSSLKTHMKIHSNQRDYSCEICNRAFVQKKTFQDHMKVHDSKNITRKALFQMPTHFCSICGKGLANEVGLRRHKRKHELGQLKSFGKLNESKGACSSGNTEFSQISNTHLTSEHLKSASIGTTIVNKAVQAHVVKPVLDIDENIDWKKFYVKIDENNLPVSESEDELTEDMCNNEELVTNAFNTNRNIVDKRRGRMNGSHVEREVIVESVSNETQQEKINIPVCDTDNQINDMEVVMELEAKEDKHIDTNAPSLLYQCLPNETLESVSALTALGSEPDENIGNITIIGKEISENEIVIHVISESELYSRQNYGNLDKIEESDKALSSDQAEKKVSLKVCNSRKEIDKGAVEDGEGMSARLIDSKEPEKMVGGFQKGAAIVEHSAKPVKESTAVVREVVDKMNRNKPEINAAEKELGDCEYVVYREKIELEGTVKIKNSANDQMNINAKDTVDDKERTVEAKRSEEGESKDQSSSQAIDKDTNCQMDKLKVKVSQKKNSCQSSRFSKLFKCKVCQKSFHLLSTLKYHTASHIDKKDLKHKDAAFVKRCGVSLKRDMLICKVCGLKFVSKLQYLVHCKRTHGTRLAHQELNKKMDSKVVRRGNEKVQTEGNDEDFKIEGQTIEGEFENARKKPSLTRNISASCDLDVDNAVESDTSEAVNVHEKLVCEKCGKKFSSPKVLQIHTSLNNCCNICVCETCDRGFGSKRKLMEHVRREHDNFPFKCLFCAKAFSTASGFNKHRKLHKDGNAVPKLVREHMCSKCGKLYSTSNALKSHMILHSGVKPFTCQFCPLKFAQKSHMTRHVCVRHHNQRDLVCTVEGCGKRFPDKYRLGNHLKTHTGERAYKCDTCGVCFSTSNTLKVHKKSQHLKLREFVCLICFQDFTTKGSLEIHMKRHVALEKMDSQSLSYEQGYVTKVKPVKKMEPKLFECPKCNRRFTTKRGMVAHQRNRCAKMLQQNSENSAVM